VPDDESVEMHGCICTTTFDQMYGPAFPSHDVKETGTYTAAGTSFTATYFTDVTYDYCVTNDILTLTPTTVAKTGTATGEIVLQK
jgi:hypothetical protein